MKRNRISAAVAALLLSGLLVACGGADNAAEIAEATATTPPPAATATKPPPVVAVITAAPGGGGGATSGNEGTGDTGAPAMPTAIPTVAPTEAPPTALPTDTPVPTAPPTARPVVVQPTAVPPTATAVPPTPAPQIGANGLVASNFAVQSRADLTVNGDVWFEFTVANSTGGEVPYNALGVMPKKDGVDRREWYQQSYGGPDSTIKPGGLSWEDHIELPEPGNYTLRLVICFDGFDACLQQRGTWHTLSAEIPVTIR